MVTFRSDTCDKCKNANPIGYRVEPAEAWRTVVLNRWRRLCPVCFDVEAEKAGVRYSFVDVMVQQAAGMLANPISSAPRPRVGPRGCS